MSDKASRIKITPALIAGILVFIFLGVALYLRIALPYDKIFVGDWIKFNGTDSYYHMRIIDNLVFNFPHLNSIDPYLLYPSGMEVGGFAFYDYFLAGIIWIVSFGSPDQHIIDVVGVYFPAVVGALTVIPVYYIGKILFNRWAGVFAACLIAILPGEFLGRTVLGFADHHAMEVFLTTVLMLFLILALKTATERELDFGQIKQRKWSVVITPIIYSIICGILLGIFFCTWRGAPLFAFIVFLFYVIQFIVNHINAKNTEYLSITGVLVFFFAFLIFIPFFEEIRYLCILIVAFIALGIMGILSWFMRRRSIKNLYYLLGIAGCTVIGFVLFYVINAEVMFSLFRMFNNVTRTGVGLTTLEAQPLLFPGGIFSLSVAWANFTTGMFLSIISLGFIITSLVKNNQPDKLLFCIWSLIILIIALSMRRFAYYFAVNVALLTGYIAWLILSRMGFQTSDSVPVTEPESKKKTKRQKRKQFGTTGAKRPVIKVTGLVVVIVLVIYPNIGPLPKIGPFPAGTKPAIDTAKTIPYIPDNAWCEACDWLKENTPEPFGDPDYYYADYENLNNEQGNTLSDDLYGVTAWWDFGYWITRMGHRIPACNPGGGKRGNTARFFTAQTERAAGRRVDKLGTKYVMIDFDTTTVKFYALAEYSGYEEDEFFDMYFKDEGNGMMRGDYYFYPEYYKSMAVRLYNFDGKETIPDNITVILYEDRVFEGESYKCILDSLTFTDYKAARRFVKDNPSGNYRIVGMSPFETCVPLEELELYKEVYRSNATEKYDDIIIPQVKTFEYTGT